MPFGVVSVGSKDVQCGWVLIALREGSIFGVDLGLPILTNGNLALLCDKA